VIVRNAGLVEQFKGSGTTFYADFSRHEWAVVKSAK